MTDPTVKVPQSLEIDAFEPLGRYLAGKQETQCEGRRTESEDWKLPEQIGGLQTVQPCKGRKMDGGLHGDDHQQSGNHAENEQIGRAHV